MRFVWPAPRHDRLTKEATLLAAALTTCAGFAIVIPAVRIYRASENVGTPATDERTEMVTFVRSGAAVVSVQRRTRSAPSTATTAPPATSPLHADTSSLITKRLEARARLEPATKPPSSDFTIAPRALGPYSAAAAAALGRIDSGAAAPPPWRWLPPTQAQRDSDERAEAHRAATARDDHRAMPIALGSIPMRMPFGGAVRSRMQRARDSVVNEDFLQRLARLAERVRAKRESTLAARIIARRDSGPTGTSKP